MYYTVLDERSRNAYLTLETFTTFFVSGGSRHRAAGGVESNRTHFALSRAPYSVQQNARGMEQGAKLLPSASGPRLRTRSATRDRVSHTMRVCVCDYAWTRDCGSGTTNVQDK
jgi:hypothetical protein